MGWSIVCRADASLPSRWGWPDLYEVFCDDQTFAVGPEHDSLFRCLKYCRIENECLFTQDEDTSYRRKDAAEFAQNQMMIYKCKLRTILLAKYTYRYSTKGQGS